MTEQFAIGVCVGIFVMFIATIFDDYRRTKNGEL